MPLYSLTHYLHVHATPPFLTIVHLYMFLLFRWFHGRISRQLACSRLQDLQGEQGVYLVRESETQPGDYAISYLSRTGYVRHFKINSNCGDYFIGGRQFSSLSELIGFYSNCSCILENESLEVPVVPPKVCIHMYVCTCLCTPVCLCACCAS